MERSEALVIAKQAYKEICKDIEETCGILEEIHGVPIQCHLPENFFIDDFHFNLVDLME